ncbi:unnamed protein product [Fusarium equiseti]|uniref:Uncharacterized protein n=1 Tax=Fusarium equiseti TaxID=61235 RepID=A0A8J2NEY9_FUSEQ|nr:unnamed protein product [Fusarium equiseti]
MEQERKWREIEWFEPGEWYETEWPWYVVWINSDWRAITDSRSEAERAAESHPTGRFRGFCRRKEARRAWSSSYDLKLWSMNPREFGLPKLSDIHDLPYATTPSGSTPENPVNLEETEESSSNREVTPEDPTPKDPTLKQRGCGNGRPRNGGNRR